MPSDPGQQRAPTPDPASAPAGGDALLSCREASAAAAASPCGDALDRPMRLPRGAERRRFRRVETPLDLRFFHEGEEVPAQLLDVSPGGAKVGSARAPEAGERVVLYADRIGRLEGLVVRRTATGFAVRFTHRLVRAKRLADALTWVLNRPPERDRRVARRYPQDEPARLSRADGSVLACRILDISTTGASVGVPGHRRPPVGERIVLGVMHARVVRHHRDGIGVLFEDAPRADETPNETQDAPGGASPANSAH